MARLTWINIIVSGIFHHIFLLLFKCFCFRCIKGPEYSSLCFVTYRGMDKSVLVVCYVRVQHQFLVPVLFVYGYVMFGREAKVSGSGCSIVPKN